MSDDDLDSVSEQREPLSSKPAESEPIHPPAAATAATGRVPESERIPLRNRMSVRLGVYAGLVTASMVLAAIMVTGNKTESALDQFEGSYQAVGGHYDDAVQSYEAAETAHAEAIADLFADNLKSRVSSYQSSEDDEGRKLALEAITEAVRGPGKSLSGLRFARVTDLGDKELTKWERETGDVAEEDSLIVAKASIPGQKKGETLGTVQVGFSRDRVNEMLAQQGQVMRERKQVRAQMAAVKKERVSSGVTLGLVAFLVGMAVVMFLVSLALRPVAETVKVLHSVSAGDLTQQLKVVANDEMGRISSSINLAVSKMHGTVTGMASNALVLAKSSDELRDASSELGEAAAHAHQRVDRVSSTAHQVIQNVTSAAGGAQKMAGSIREIAKNAQKAVQVATSAADVAQETSDTITRVDESSGKIASVIRLITSIAEQANLLALNAVIEADRAGEAGLGFAVVANEVKELSRETSQATNELRPRIDALQEDVQHTIEAIEKICALINQVSDLQANIAAAVEEQNQTRLAMEASLSEAVDGTAEIVQDVTSVAVMVRSTADGANSTREAAEGLSSIASELQRLVERFKC